MLELAITAVGFAFLEMAIKEITRLSDRTVFLMLASAYVTAKIIFIVGPLRIA